LDELIRNYKAFLNSHVKPEDPSFVLLYHWLEAHFRSYKEMPSIELLYERARTDGNEALLANLTEVVGQIPYIRSDYLSILKEKFEVQMQGELQNTLSKTWQVVNTGMKVGKKEIKGMKAALEYLAGETRKFRMMATGVKTYSQILSKEDAQEVFDSYRKRKKDPMANTGLFTFFDKIDDAYRGIKPGDLFIIAAFTSQGKSTLAANFAYNGIMQGLNGMIVPLEKNFLQTRDYFYILHTCNPDWYDHPKYKHLAGKISMEKFKYGELSESEDDFINAVAMDFADRSSKGKFGELKIWQPTESLTPASLELEVIDYQAELVERGKTLDFLIVDYVGLMVQDKNEKYGDYNIDLNNIIKKLKNFALTFNEGKGLRVITPFQTNREGWKEAVKNDGIFKLTALSNANESERSADGVITLFMTEEMRRTGLVKIGCLKNRDGAYFPPFETQINYLNMRMEEVIQTKAERSDDMAIQDISLEAGQN